MDTQVIFSIASAGAVISFLLWSARRQQLFLQRLVENHLKHNTAAQLTLATAINRLEKIITQFHRGV